MNCKPWVVGICAGMVIGCCMAMMSGKKKKCCKNMVGRTLRAMGDIADSVLDGMMK